MIFVCRWKHFSCVTCTFAGCMCSHVVDAPYGLHIWVCVSVITVQLLLVLILHFQFSLQRKFCVFLFTPPRDGKQHLVLWRDNQVTNWRASDFCQWGCLMRSLAEGNPILMGGFFLQRLRKIRRQLKEKMAMYCIFLVCSQLACWRFNCYLVERWLMQMQKIFIVIH